MNNNKRISIFLLIAIIAISLLPIRVRAATWSTDEAVETVEARIGRDNESNLNSNVEVIEYLQKKELRVIKILAVIAFAICILIIVLGAIYNWLLTPAIPLVIFIVVFSIYSLVRDRDVSEVDKSEARIELGLEDEIDTDSDEYLFNVVKEIVNEIYSKGDIVEEYTQEQATKEVLRLIGISRGRVISSDLIKFKTSVY